MNKVNSDKENINQINTHLWRLFDILRGSSIEDLQVIFLMISAYKDGLFKNRTFNNSMELLKYIVGQLYHSDKYFEIFQVYEPIIQLMAPKRLDAMYNFLLSIDGQELEVLQDDFSEIFETLLSKYLNLLGKSSGEISQPFEITRFIMNLANLSENASVYNPFAGLGTYGILLSKGQKYYGQEINANTWALGMLRFLADRDFEEVYYSSNNGGFKDWNGDVVYDMEDTIDDWFDDQIFDLVVSTPPFNLKINSQNVGDPSIKTAEQFLIKNGLQSLKEGGKLICVLPMGFLFKGGDDKRLREELVQKGYLESIITLPSGLFKNTGIPVCILVINNTHLNNGRVRMVNATEFFISNNPRDKKLDDVRLTEFYKNPVENDFQRFVSNDEIQHSDYNLNVPRYFIKDYPGIALATVVEQCRGERIEKEEIGRAVRIRDLKDDKLDYLLDLEQIEVNELPRFVKKIEESALLVSMRWKTLKPTYFKYEGSPIYISNEIIALKIDESKANIHYLINELHSENSLKQADSYRLSNVIPTIRKEDLFNIKIVIPSLEDQAETISLAKKEYILKEQEKLNVLIDEYSLNVADENSFLRHQIAGAVKNSRKSFNSMIAIINEQLLDKHDGLMDLTKPNSTLTFGKYIEIISRDLASISHSVKRTGRELDLTEDKFEDIDIVIFIKNYIDEVKERSGASYKVILLADHWLEEDLEAENIQSVIVNGNKQLLRKMFDNLIENAETHGFENSNYSNHELIFEIMFSFETSEMQINVSNTGTPLPENFTFEGYKRKGSTAGQNGGDGFGGWFVNDVMKKHKGAILDVSDEFYTEYKDVEVNKTTVEIKFPIKFETYE